MSFWNMFIFARAPASLFRGLLHLASVAIFLAQLAGSLAIVGMFLYVPV